MKHYTKDGITKPQNRIVLHTTETIDGIEHKFQVINPPHDMLIEQGWVEYIEPSEEEVANRQEAMRQRNKLAASDYKIIKCIEAYLCGEALPYDIEALHIERNNQRKTINSLENEDN